MKENSTAKGHFMINKEKLFKKVFGNRESFLKSDKNKIFKII